MDSGKRTPMYAQVHHFMLDQIHSGRWREGRRLPSENQLCKQFGVSRITIRGAMDKLAEDGLIYRVQGKGSFVARMDERKEPELYARPIRDDDGIMLVALLVPWMHGSFITELANGLEAALNGSRYRILLMSTEDSQAKENERIKEAISAGAKGIVVYPSSGQAYNEHLLKLSLDRYPLVVIDRYVRGVETNCVCSDHYAGAYEATEYLLRLGHRRIAFLTMPANGTTSLEERREGYRQALNDYGVVYDKGIVLEQTEPGHIHDFLKRHADLTAVFATHDYIGLKAMSAAETIGKRVPERLSVIFFDDYIHSEHALVPPTCVTQQSWQIGVEAGERILSLIDNPMQERVSIRLPTRLAIRNSTAPPVIPS